ncbi:MAG TPA: hypothetical protein VE441_06520 [Mycobacterium sp.]|nr:hypothetical protein [Mycobacterium sp.]
MGTHRHRITVRGALSRAAQEAFEGFEIALAGGATIIFGRLDQAALHGVLHRIERHGLELVAVQRDG